MSETMRLAGNPYEDIATDEGNNLNGNKNVKEPEGDPNQIRFA